MTTAIVKRIATGGLLAVGLVVAALAAGPTAAHPCRDCTAPRPCPVVEPCQLPPAPPADSTLEQLHVVVAPPKWAMACDGVDVIFQVDETDEANHAVHKAGALP